VQHLKLEELNSIANEVGVTLAAVTPLKALAEHAQRLAHWQRQAWAADMHYMLREPEGYCDIGRLLPAASQVLSFVIPYASTLTQTCQSGYGRVARYAWGDDYHTVIAAALERFVSMVTERIGRKPRYRVATDAVPILERALLWESIERQGFFGRNSLMIIPRLGSFFFIAELLWDLDTPSGVLLRVGEGGCGSCQRCVAQCPTAAITEEGFIDARRCISYLTIEKRGIFNLAERAAIGEWVFGCDICQEVCPFNHRLSKIEPPLALVQLGGNNSTLVLEDLLRIRTDAEFKARFGKRALTRAKRPGLLRNAACVAANTLAVNAAAALYEALTDTSPIVRRHALWALGVLWNKKGDDMVKQGYPAPEMLRRLCIADSDLDLKAEGANVLCLLEK
jgi:epoxyqueuosine reductase